MTERRAECLRCGLKIPDERRFGPGRPPDYCSKRCGEIARLERKDSHRPAVTGTRFFSGECAWCRDPFDARSPQQRYCCTPCSVAGRNEETKGPVDNVVKLPRGRYLRTCGVCGEQFVTGRRSARYCSRKCCKHQSAADSRLVHRFKSYGISHADYLAMIEVQGGTCAICGDATPGTQSGEWCIDHCHDTGRVRGLLCSHCNIGIGNLKDDPLIVARAVWYLNNAGRQLRAVS